MSVTFGAVLPTTFGSVVDFLSVIINFWVTSKNKITTKWTNKKDNVSPFAAL
ncbi:MAG: hypothetical protein ACJASL_002835 [Paraglaciecola sp.]|jgi:hypothetical protein